MKKALFLFIIVPFLLSACFQKHSNEECRGYESKIMSEYKDYIESSFSLFYSKKVDSCVFAYTGVAGAAKPGELVPIKNYIVDYSNKKILLETIQIEEWQNKVREMRGDVAIKRDEKPTPKVEKDPKTLECEKLTPEINESIKKRTEKDGNARELKEIFYSPKNNKCYYSETIFQGKKDPNRQQSFRVLAYEYGVSENLNEASCAFEYTKTGWKERVE